MKRRVRLRRTPQAQALRAALEAVRAEFEVPGDFPPAVLAEAQRAAAGATPPALDAIDVEFVTIDPPGSMDLDQAVAIERDGAGFRVRYAIADVPGFVEPGGAIDAEARDRVQTLYLPDGRAPLHPPVLSEDAASLLPDVDRPAFVWDLRLDADGRTRATQVRRSLVRSRARLDYAGVQADLDAGRARPDSTIALLETVGRLRLQLEADRGGASLPMPEQEVYLDDEEHYRLRYRPPLPAEDYNAQISLLTGMAAADLMLAGGVGILRTMPAPDPRDVQRFQRVARAHGLEWPEQLGYGEFLRGLDRENPVQLSLIHEATRLFRGAAYTAFDGKLPELLEHAAVAAPYAHVTAPLRRLVDRFGLVVCAALSAGEPVPQWARIALSELPALMRAGDQRASAIDRACTDAVEAAELSDRVGEEFDAVIVDDRGEKGLVVALGDPAVVAGCDGPEAGAAEAEEAAQGAQAAEGDAVRVRLREADIAARRVRFTLVG